MNVKGGKFQRLAQFLKILNHVPTTGMFSNCTYYCVFDTDPTQYLSFCLHDWIMRRSLSSTFVWCLGGHWDCSHTTRILGHIMHPMLVVAHTPYVSAFQVQTSCQNVKTGVRLDKFNRLWYSFDWCPFYRVSEWYRHLNDIYTSYPFSRSGKYEHFSSERYSGTSEWLVCPRSRSSFDVLHWSRSQSTTYFC